MTVEQVRDNLRRQVEAQQARPDGQATRGIKINNSTGDYIGDLYPAGSVATVPATGEAGPGQAPVPVPAPLPAAPSLQFVVEFELNSYRFTQASREKLAIVAAALRDPQLAAQTWAVIGHTDALGPAGYNQVLSERRAASVVDGLQLLGAPARLVAAGRGETELLPGAAPNAPANRRVEIRLVAR
jgi:outer membrane protein OmpA-like peptidoglycan-associated protein